MDYAEIGADLGTMETSDTQEYEAEAQEAETQEQEAQEVEQPFNYMDFTKGFVDYQQARENALREEFNAKLEATKPKEPLSAEEEQLNYLSEKLGLKTLTQENNELKTQLQALQAQAQEAQTKADIATLESKYNDFKGSEIYSYLVELNKTNPQLATALDNPQGWEMIYQMQKGAQQVQIMQETPKPKPNYAQAKQPDFMLNSTQGNISASQDLENKIKSGYASYAEMGALFK